MAENPQQTVRELQELIVTYLKQETVEPLAALKRYVAFGLGGGVLLGFGALFLEIGLLRVLQEETSPHLTGNWSWVPYFVVVIISAAVAGLVWMMRNRKKAKSGRA